MDHKGRGRSNVKSHRQVSSKTKSRATADSDKSQTASRGTSDTAEGSDSGFRLLNPLAGSALVEVATRSSTTANTPTSSGLTGELPVSADHQSGSTFESLGVCKWLVQQCSSIGLKAPTPIQRACIPEILAGRDCIGCAKTGSGKTAAFAMPILQRLAVDPYGVFALVLTPTRELAMQIADQFRVLGKPMNLKHSVIVGGMDMMAQGLELARKPHVVIATPGRLADHLNSTVNFDLSHLKFLVLDEADRLFEKSFEEPLTRILGALSPQRQTLLFSATMTKNLEELETMAMTNVFHFEAESSTATVESLDQRYVFMPARVRDCYLAHIVREHQGSSMMIFAGSCKQCETVALLLRELGIECASLHSQMSQQQRLSSLARFRGAMVSILVATDVASRGLDIPAVKLVLNFNVPNSPVDYVHRVGRTARAGRGGQAITFVSQYDVDLLHAIEETTHKKMELYETAESEVLKQLNEVFAAKSAAVLKLSELGFEDKKKRYKNIHAR